MINMGIKKKRSSLTTNNLRQNAAVFPINLCAFDQLVIVVAAACETAHISLCHALI